LQVAHARDAGGHGDEDDRSDQHLDQLHEAVAERLELDAPCGPQPPDEHSQRDRHQHLHVQGAAAARRRCVHALARLMHPLAVSLFLFMVLAAPVTYELDPNKTELLAMTTPGGLPGASHPHAIVATKV